jgi:Response regulator containing a CheY-like receiver domain and an HTH DNA-binding domain
LEVFRLIGREFKTSRIARELGLSVKTIQTYRERIKTKLGLKDAIELISNAVRWVQSQNQ